MQKDLKEKRSCKYSLPCHLESYHVASKSSSFQDSSFIKNVTGIVQMDCVRLCSSKTAEGKEENIKKLDLSLNRQNIKLFVSTPVTDFCACRATVNLTLLLNFSRKLFFIKNDIETLFFPTNRLQNRGVHYT